MEPATAGTREPDDREAPTQLAVALVVRLPPPSDASYLAALFDDLATNWRGWFGSKWWTELDGDLSLECTHDGLGHITIIVELYPRLDPLDPARWHVRGGLVIDAGALAELAHSAHRFLRV